MRHFNVVNRDHLVVLGIISPRDLTLSVSWGCTYTNGHQHPRRTGRGWCTHYLNAVFAYIDFKKYGIVWVGRRRICTRQPNIETFASKRLRVELNGSGRHGSWRENKGSRPRADSWPSTPEWNVRNRNRAVDGLCRLRKFPHYTYTTYTIKPWRLTPQSPVLFGLTLCRIDIGGHHLSIFVNPLGINTVDPSLETVAQLPLLRCTRYPYLI